MKIVQGKRYKLDNSEIVHIVKVLSVEDGFVWVDSGGIKSTVPIESFQRNFKEVTNEKVRDKNVSRS